MRARRYALDLSKRDPDNHIRDRARFLDSIVLGDKVTLRAGAVTKLRSMLASRLSTLFDTAGDEQREDKSDK